MVVHGSSSEEELDDIIPTAMAPTPTATPTTLNPSSGTEEDAAGETSGMPMTKRSKPMGKRRELLRRKPSRFSSRGEQELGAEAGDSGMAEARADGNRLAVKSQFEGEAGEKLFRLQMRFKGASSSR